MPIILERSLMLVITPCRYQSYLRSQISLFPSNLSPTNDHSVILWWCKACPYDAVYVCMVWWVEGALERVGIGEGAWKLLSLAISRELKALSLHSKLFNIYLCISFPRINKIVRIAFMVIKMQMLKSPRCPLGVKKQPHSSTRQSVA